jgi:hypothetical protein
MVLKLDDEDQALFDRYRWQWDGRYVMCQCDGFKRYFHQEVMGNPFRLVDHRDRDGLNCWKSNLRLATHPQNMQNRGPRRDSPTGFKGVAVKRGKRKTTYEAYIYHEDRRVGLGTHIGPFWAGLAHHCAAQLLRGEWAPDLFPGQTIPPGIRRTVVTKLKRRGLLSP